jgi:hypothetical protein
LCQRKDRAHSQVNVLIHEYGIEYPFNTCSVAEHSPGIGLRVDKVLCGIYLLYSFLDRWLVLLRHLIKNIPYRMRSATLKGDVWIDLGEDGDKPLPSVCADHLESRKSPVEKVGEKGSPFGSAFRRCKTEVDDLFLPIMADTECHEDWTGQGTCSCFSLYNDSIENKRAEPGGEPSCMEGTDGVIQGLCHPAHRLRADLLSQDRAEGNADLSR